MKRKPRLARDGAEQSSPLQPGSLLSLQQAASNRAVTALVGDAKTKLDDLVDECDDYLSDTSGKAKRRGAVIRLSDEAVEEREVVEKLADAVAATTPDQCFAATVAAQDRQVRSLKSGRLRNAVVVMGNWLMTAIGRLRGDAAAMTRVMQSEVQRLIDLRYRADTPALTGQILAEVLSSAEAKFADPANPALDYHVHHRLNAPLGTAERLGSLTHELTHVSVSKTSQNTSRFFAFKTGATDAEILELVRKRNARLADMLLWVIPEDNAFYRRLRVVAQEALPRGSTRGLGDACY